MIIHIQGFTWIDVVSISMHIDSLHVLSQSCTMQSCIQSSAKLLCIAD